MLISNRANTILLVAILAVGIGIVAMLATGARGGPLDPPGAPAATDGVREPGTPISSVPFAITQPGRYYLTRNLSLGTSGTAITITADTVDLDLGGFTLDGLTAANFGIYDLGQAHDNVTVEHGVVRGFFSAIYLTSMSHGHIADVQVRGTSGGGPDISTPRFTTLEDCEVSEGDIGVNLLAQSVIRQCHIHDVQNIGVNAFDSTVIEDNVVEKAQATGVSFTNGSRVTVRNNRLMSNGPTRNSDVVIGTGAGMVIDNVIDCVTSLSATGTGQIVTSDAAGGHQNAPLFAAGFC